MMKFCISVACLLFPAVMSSQDWSGTPGPGLHYLAAHGEKQKILTTRSSLLGIKFSDEGNRRAQTSNATCDTENTALSQCIFNTGGSTCADCLTEAQDQTLASETMTCGDYEDGMCAAINEDCVSVCGTECADESVTFFGCAVLEAGCSSFECDSTSSLPTASPPSPCQPERDAASSCISSQDCADCLDDTFDDLTTADQVFCIDLENGMCAAIYGGCSTCGTSCNELVEDFYQCQAGEGGCSSFTCLTPTSPVSPSTPSPSKRSASSPPTASPIGGGNAGVPATAQPTTGSGTRGTGPALAKESSSSSNAGLIGGILGGIVVLIIIGATSYICFLQGKMSRSELHNDTPTGHYPGFNANKNQGSGPGNPYMDVQNQPPAAVYCNAYPNAYTNTYPNAYPGNTNQYPGATNQYQGYANPYAPANPNTMQPNTIDAEPIMVSAVVVERMRDLPSSITYKDQGRDYQEVMQERNSRSSGSNHNDQGRYVQGGVPTPTTKPPALSQAADPTEEPTDNADPEVPIEATSHHEKSKKKKSKKKKKESKKEKKESTKETENDHHEETGSQQNQIDESVVFDL